MNPDPTYNKWLSDRMWKNGLHLFADSEKEEEIKKIAFQISIKNDINIAKQKYKGTEIFLLYIEKNQFSLVPSPYYYSTIDTLNSVWLHLSDVISMYKSLPELVQS
jgi:hypothetical protein